MTINFVKMVFMFMQGYIVYKTEFYCFIYYLNIVLNKYFRIRYIYNILMILFNKNWQSNKLHENVSKLLIFTKETCKRFVFNYKINRYSCK